MNRLADNVLKGMDDAQKKEDQAIAKYVYEKEKKLRKADVKKAKLVAKTKEEMKTELFKQQEDKANKERDERANLNEQANMWAKEREIW